MRREDGMPPPSYAQQMPARGSSQRGCVSPKPRADARAGSAARREDGMPPLLCVTNACEEKLAAQLRIPKPHCGENRMPPPCNALYADCRCE